MGWDGFEMGWARVEWVWDGTLHGVGSTFHPSNPFLPWLNRWTHPQIHAGTAPDTELDDADLSLKFRFLSSVWMIRFRKRFIIKKLARQAIERLATTARVSPPTRTWQPVCERIVHKEGQEETRREEREPVCFLPTRFSEIQHSILIRNPKRHYLVVSASVVQSVASVPFPPQSLNPFERRRARKRREKGKREKEREKKKRERKREEKEKKREEKREQRKKKGCRCLLGKCLDTKRMVRVRLSYRQPV